MLMEVKAHIKLLQKYFGFNIASLIEYRTSFLIGSTGMIINNATFILFWWVVFQNAGQIGNYTFKDICLIWALSSSAFGFLIVFFGRIGSISQMIISGDLDSILVQPKNPLINLISSKTDVGGWGDLIYGYIILFVFYGINFKMLVLFTIFVILGSVVMGSMMLMIETLTFYIGDSTGIRKLYLATMLTFGTYPESVFKGVAKFVSFSFVPAGFFVFMPVNIMNYFNWKNMMILLFIDIFYVGLSYCFFMRGIKRYESGNLIGAKV
jgi:ABC-2 type transport system permease protein